MEDPAEIPRWTRAIAYGHKIGLGIRARSISLADAMLPTRMPDDNLRVALLAEWIPTDALRRAVHCPDLAVPGAFHRIALGSADIHRHLAEMAAAFEVLQRLR